jgi:AraC family transcriptional regulator, transcriptional activator of pobA
VKSKEFQPILLEDLKIRWPGFAIRRVALNQHMPRVEKLGEHVHRFSQILLYLRGTGVQHLGMRSLPVDRGSVLVIPPGQAHRFEKTRAVRPICLAIDFETVEPVTWTGHAVLGARDLALVERWLLSLHEQRGRRDDYSIQTAALILRLLSRLERAVNGSDERGSDGPVAASVRSVATRHGLAALTPGAVATSLGRTLDHLNRQLQAEGGTTVGGVLNRLRLDEATRLLRGSDRGIGEIAAAIGMDDQNYFTRWFRKQTGQTPTRWRAAMR